MRLPHVAPVLLPLVFSALAACSDAEESAKSGAGGPAPGSSLGEGGYDGGGAAPGLAATGTPGGSDASATPADAAPPKPTRVPMLVAHGKLGRTTVSCDDGNTWIANRSEDDAARCWDDTAAKNVECDHNAWSSTGLVAAGDWFLASYGWGYPGVVRRTEDGITWEDVLPGHTFAGLSFGNGRVLATERTPYVSSSFGATGSWSTVGDVDSPVWNVRKSGFVPEGTGRFIISLESAETDIRYSDDNGATWKPASSRDAGCGHWVSSIVYGNGTTVIGQNDGSVCWSTDRGDTWKRVAFTTDLSSPVILTKAGTFMAWQGSKRWESADGKAWTMTQGTSGVIVGSVAQAADTGTFVAVQGGWQQYYEKQKFYRSADGVTWTALPDGAYVKSHPITSITFGHAKPSVECPL